ncbi:hypothetical protein LINPERHAP1_LOCUS9363 [Linum perenne]
MLGKTLLKVVKNQLQYPWPSWIVFSISHSPSM